jgi:DNA mismatch repair protein MutS
MSTTDDDKTIIGEHLDYQENYTKKYGSKTLVLEQVGSFYEAYATHTRGYKLSEIATSLNLTLTRKNKKIDTVDESNPMLIGFPSAAIEKYMNLLVDSGFTVVVINQITPPPRPKRKVIGVFSIGTYITKSMLQDSNNIVCLYIEDTANLISIGMSVIDLSTGDNTVYESYSTISDPNLSLDEAVRFINSYNPKETLIYRKESDGTKTKDQLIQYLELESRIYHYYPDINRHFQKISYQNEFLKKIFPDTGMLTPIEHLDMEKMPFATSSLIALLDYSYQHSENLIKHIYKTKIYNNNQHLILGNNAIYQLNIFESSLFEGPANSKFKSLFDVVNNTSTAPGKRYLRNMLNSPIINDKDLILYYSCTEELQKDNLYLQLEDILKNMSDVERLQRKLMLSLLQPFELAALIESYDLIDNIIKIITKTKHLKLKLPDKLVLRKFDELTKDLSHIFNTEELKKNNLSDITSSFFNKDINKDIDKLEAKINGNVKFMENICKVLSDQINDIFSIKKKKKKEDTPDDQKIYLHKNDRDGYYLSLTKLRAKSLQKSLAKHKSLKITDDYNLDPTKLTYKELPKGNTKIFIEDLSDKSDDTFSLKEQLSTLIISQYQATLKKYQDKYPELFRELSKFIAIIDYIKSSAKTAIMYNYVKPTIKESKNSFVTCTSLRHPVVERIKTDCEYVPHDISLGTNNLDGMLVFGLNSAGKSVLMKAVGISVIMAQAGMFVPAKSFEYSPYYSLFARITGNDNIFKGLSSFALEITELRAILKRAGPHCLIIGDELTKGTEHRSGNCIVAATIIMLSKSGSSFMFATHLHDIAKMDRIKELKNVKCFHLTVEYDKENDLLIFDRKLKPGSGEEIYGLTVAKYIIHDDSFVKLSQEIMNESLNKQKHLLNDKTSRYNSNVYIDKCQICNKPIESKDFMTNLDSHHINFQKDCENDFVKSKPHLKKDSEANIVVVCKNCHHKIHDNNKELEVTGYQDTSRGKKLKVNKLTKT